MLYKFKSSATAELIMLEPQGDAMLLAIGREPAPRGIIEAADLPSAITKLKAAIEAAESQPETARDALSNDNGNVDDDAARHDADPGMRQRMWPMLQMMEASREANVPIVWGV